MSAPTHQTVRLEKGKHGGPAHGLCVMELAPMLAGERFSDQPRTVCPIVAAFLRAYNDWVDDDRRQDLYRFASAAVGTSASTAVRRRDCGSARIGAAGSTPLCVPWRGCER